MKLGFRAFLLTFAGEAIVIIAAWIPRRHLADVHSASVTILWASLFACGTAIVIGLSLPIQSWTRTRLRLTSITLSIILAILSYTLAFAVTGGAIAGLIFPLLLVFLGGATFALVGIFWKGGLVSAAVSLAVVLLIGYSLSAAPFLAARRRPTHITVVKYIPEATSQLRILSSPGTEISEFERSTLSTLNLHGVLQISRTFSLGAASGHLSHMIIVLEHPVAGDTALSEPDTDIVYLQEGNAWKTLPENSKVTFRKVELYPISGNCTAIAVWNSLGQQSATGGPCW
jgi:hypothetical protein